MERSPRCRTQILRKLISSPPTRGRPFAKGNPGRRPGSRNRTTLITTARLESEAEELERKGIEIAKAGDVAMLKFFLARVLPPEPLIVIPLPRMESADDAVEALDRIIRAISEGHITPSEGAAFAGMVNSLARAIDIADLVKRMDALEATLTGHESK